MQTNPVIEAIQAAFQMEIANQFTTKDDTLVVTLPDGGHLTIGATPITPTAKQAPHQPATHSEHTYHYVHQHDFGYGNGDEQSLTRLLLRSEEDCRSYLDDVCHTFLDATFRDYEITFPDGSAYLLTVDPA